jgi:hypothetical protein
MSTCSACRNVEIVPVHQWSLRADLSRALRARNPMSMYTPPKVRWSA